MAVVPVFMYHHVNPNGGDVLTVTPSDFESHLRAVRDGGYRVLGLSELLAFMEGSLQLSGRSVVITFDDGYLDNYVYAFPLLREYGVRAAVFVPTAWLDGATASGLGAGGIEHFRRAVPTHAESKVLVSQGRYSAVVMDWHMAREMQGSGLVEFGSHTVTHAGCDALGPGDLRVELEGSRERLERELQSPCVHLCWPRGRFSEAAVAMAAAVGYRTCFTTRRGVVTEGSDPLYVERIATKGGAQWLGRRLAIYTRAVLSRAYLAVRGGGR